MQPLIPPIIIVTSEFTPVHIIVKIMLAQKAQA